MAYQRLAAPHELLSTDLIMRVLRSPLANFGICVILMECYALDLFSRSQANKRRTYVNTVRHIAPTRCDDKKVKPLKIILTAMTEWQMIRMLTRETRR